MIAISGNAERKSQKKMGLIVVPFGRDMNKQDMTHEQLRFGLVKDRMMSRKISDSDSSLYTYGVLRKYTRSQIRMDDARHGSDIEHMRPYHHEGLAHRK